MMICHLRYLEFEQLPKVKEPRTQSDSASGRTRGSDE